MLIKPGYQLSDLQYDKQNLIINVTNKVNLNDIMMQ